MGKKDPRSRKHVIGFWVMVRDVLVNSMRYGQFPIALVAGIVVVVLVKMPPDDVSRLSFEIVGDLKNFSLLGWVLFFFALVAWYLHQKWQRRIIAAEMERIGAEKSRLQGDRLGKALPSSERE